MEEQILKSMTNRLHSMAGHSWLIGLGNDDCIESTKEITSMVMEFIKWKDDPDNVGCFDGNEVYFIFDLSEEKGHTIEQIFDYWFNNIRNK